MSRYKLLSQLGAGSMGEVWRATRRLSDGADQDVAIKFVHEQWHDERDALERFQLEGRVGLDLHHTNIVDVYDLDSIKGRPCIVMELIDGVSLDTLMKSHSLPHEIVRLILRDALAGLRHAHKAGILHRDLSPGNIMIGRNGVARLTDFGMAKDLRKPQTIGMLLGTLPYLAPEVLRLQEWSPGTDMYSLGAVFYEVLTSRVPWHADNRRELLDAMRSESLAPLPRAVPRDIRAFINTALNLAPERHAEAIAAADVLAPADDSLRPQLGRVVAGLLNAGPADLETAPTVQLRATRLHQVDADLAADTQADPAPTPAPKPRNRRPLALVIAAAALVAGLVIGHQSTDRPTTNKNHQVTERIHQEPPTPPRVIRQTPPAPIERPAPSRAENPPAPEPAKPRAKQHSQVDSLRDIFFAE